MSSTLRILSYNIHKGLSAGNRRVVLPRIREAVHELAPDLVFLQEVVGEHSKHAARFSDWPATSQYEFLSADMFPYAVYGMNCIYAHGHHGNALLSRYPIGRWSNTDVSAHRFEQRGVLHAEVELVPGYPLHCLCVHLGLARKGRDQQLLRLGDIIRREVPPGQPFILAGDFNDWSKRASHSLAGDIGAKEVFKTHRGRYARTFPSWFPIFPLDRIYYRGIRLYEAHALTKLPWRALSDHGAILAEFSVDD